MRVLGTVSNSSVWTTCVEDNLITVPATGVSQGGGFSSGGGGMSGGGGTSGGGGGGRSLKDMRRKNVEARSCVALRASAECGALG